MIYLPMNVLIQNCWAQYMDGIGYDVKTYGDGNYHVKWKGEGDKVLHASLLTFYSIWKQNFAHIKVSHAIEDICNQCYCLANCHKFLESNGINSLEDESLFVEEPDPDGTYINGNGLDDGGEDPTKDEQEKMTYKEELT